jgi:hypothetical protein
MGFAQNSLCHYHAIAPALLGGIKGAVGGFEQRLVICTMQ